MATQQNKLGAALMKMVCGVSWVCVVVWTWSGRPGLARATQSAGGSGTQGQGLLTYYVNEEGAVSGKRRGNDEAFAPEDADTDVALDDVERLRQPNGIRIQGQSYTQCDGGATTADSGVKLAKAGFKFPDYAGGAKAHGFDEDPGNLIGKVLIIEQNPGPVSWKAQVNWFTTRDVTDAGKINKQLVHDREWVKRWHDNKCGNGGGCAAEIDFSEANNCGLQFSIHLCEHDGNTGVREFLAKVTNQEGLQSRIKGDKEKNGPFDGWGCYTNVQNEYAADWFEEGAEIPLNATQDLWGPNQYIDAKQWHELAWYFKPDENGDIDAIWVRLKQGNKAAVVPVCTDEIMANGDPDFPKGWSKTYLKMFSRHLKGGLKWNVGHTKWGPPHKGSMAWLSKYRNGTTNPHCDRNPLEEFPELEFSTEGEHFKNVRIFTPGNSCGK